jgi:hypothetical protein
MGWRGGHQGDQRCAIIDGEVLGRHDLTPRFETEPVGQPEVRITGVIAPADDVVADQHQVYTLVDGDTVVPVVRAGERAQFGIGHHLTAQDLDQVDILDGPPRKMARQTMEQWPSQSGLIYEIRLPSSTSDPAPACRVGTADPGAQPSVRRARALLTDPPSSTML